MNVCDEAGKQIAGVIRTDGHGLIVDNMSAYNKYLMEKAKAEEFLALKRDVAEIKELLSSLLNTLNTLKK